MSSGGRHLGREINAIRSVPPSTELHHHLPAADPYLESPAGFLSVHQCEDVAVSYVDVRIFAALGEPDIIPMVVLGGEAAEVKTHLLFHLRTGVASCFWTLHSAVGERVASIALVLQSGWQQTSENLRHHLER